MLQIIQYVYIIWITIYKCNIYNIYFRDIELVYLKIYKDLTI